MTAWPSVRFPMLLLLLAGCGSDTSELREIEVGPDVPPGGVPGEPADRSSLQVALEGVTGPARLHLAPGHYILQPVAYTDPTCGNCQDPATAVPGTLGLRISGTRVELVGGDADSVIIHTNAGYGLLLEDCAGCLVRGVTITGGIRDTNGQATNGAVVIRRSTVRIEDCRIRDNLGDSATVAQTIVGIAGVVGREGSDFTLTGCRIERNSWDGVALYRGALAQIHDNLIDGVDKASGARMTGGRGVGIGLTWDAQAEISGNRVTRYWKGIGVFVNAHATVRHNIVEDILTWGIAYWGAGGGRTAARIHENVIAQTGACGAMISRESGGEVPPGFFRANVIVESGQNERYDSGEPYCPQRPIARSQVPDGFLITDNLLFNNRQPTDAWPLENEFDEPAFRAALAPLMQSLRERPMLRGSVFLQRFGGGER